MDTVEIYWFISEPEEAENEYGYENETVIDLDALDCVLPFLCKLGPALCSVFIGGWDVDCDWRRSFDDWYGSKKLERDCCFDPEVIKAYRRFLVSCAKSYALGLLPSTLRFNTEKDHSLIPYTGAHRSVGNCCWKEVDGDNELFGLFSGRDTPCKTCTLLCNHFPFAQVAYWSISNRIPCIKPAKRWEILRKRSPVEAVKLMTETLARLVKDDGTICSGSMYPGASHVIVYKEEIRRRIEALVKYGADVKDPRMREGLLQKCSAELDQERCVS